MSRRAEFSWLVACVIGCLASAALAAGPAAAGTKWLCRPGLSDNPCSTSLTTTRFTPGGTKLGVDHPKPVKKPKVDCFYVYATVSDQSTPNATLTIDPVQRSIALVQAARYSQYCRVYAPVYRQLTLAAIGASPADQAAAGKVAYADVLAAWRDYLAHDNHGRGVILMGHSQGSFHLIHLIRDQIDRKPAVRKRIVSALLLGGNLAVRKGKDSGGDFQHVPLCRKRTQTGCAIAFSTFDQPVPSDVLFGRPGGAIDSVKGGPSGSKYEAACTNPASLGGGAGRIDPIFSTVPFAKGTIASLIPLLEFTVPSASTPWLELVGAYRAQCSSAGDANVLQVRALDGAPTPKPSPAPSWGLHLVDPSIALGNLLELVHGQISAYERAASRHL